MLKSEPVQAAATPPSRADQMLLDFVREHDAACPVCGYNVRALTRPICPECATELVLAVGAARLRLEWLLATVAPGFFSGIAAFFVLIPIVLRYVIGDGRWSYSLIALDLFGWCSGLFAMMIAARRLRFIAQPRARQRWWAIIIRAVHVAALGLFILFGFLYG
ncbi:MAG: hypothetical protein ACKVU4_08200 [Phycisphaerales bacterium]